MKSCRYISPVLLLLQLFIANFQTLNGFAAYLGCHFLDWWNDGSIENFKWNISWLIATWQLGYLSKLYGTNIFFFYLKTWAKKSKFEHDVFFWGGGRYRLPGPGFSAPTHKNARHTTVFEAFCIDIATSKTASQWVMMQSSAWNLIREWDWTKGPHPLPNPLT